MRYFAEHLHDQQGTWVGYSIRKWLPVGGYREVGIIYQKTTLKKILNALND